MSNVTPCKPSTGCAFATAPVSGMVLSEGGGQMDLSDYAHLLTYHRYSPPPPIKIALRPTRATPQRHLKTHRTFTEKLFNILFPPKPVKGEGGVCVGPLNSLLYQQSGMTTQTHGFVTSKMLLHFCIEMHSYASCSRSVKLVLLMERGPFPHLPKCCRYEHDG